MQAAANNANKMTSAFIWQARRLRIFISYDSGFSFIWCVSGKFSSRNVVLFVLLAQCLDEKRCWFWIPSPKVNPWHWLILVSFFLLSFEISIASYMKMRVNIKKKREFSKRTRKKINTKKRNWIMQTLQKRKKTQAIKKYKKRTYFISKNFFFFSVQ